MGVPVEDTGSESSELTTDEMFEPVSGSETSSDPSTTGADTGGADTTTGAQDSTGGDVPPACPNGVLEPGEACDDGNDIDGDGCNNDCNPSGEQLWEVQIDDEQVQHLEFDGQGALTVAVSAYNDDAVDLRRFSADGELLWSVDLEGFSVADLSVRESGHAVVYSHSAFGNTAGMWVGAFDPEGALEWAVEHAGYPWGHGIFATEDGGYVESYTQGGPPHLERFDDAQQLQWSTSIPAGRLFAAPDDGLFIVDPFTAVTRVDSAGQMIWGTAAFEGPSAVAPGTGDLWTVRGPSLPDVEAYVLTADQRLDIKSFGITAAGDQLGPIAVDADGVLLVSIRELPSTLYTVEKRHETLGLLWSQQMSGLEDIAIDPGTSRVAIGGQDLRVFRP